ncbi:MAG TPA: type II toxin-antitoxin system HicB family antitoxin [Candidatus Deferrimicrobium sp.]|nr:type II toxin-antitoxin system HicB family antitoxin [Candidatus Deferrimicrobium sp.]
MAVRFILTGYVNRLMNQAVYDKLEDGTFAGRIPPCKGVIAFGSTLKECEDELHSTLEDWVLLGLQLGHHLPVIRGINLNKRPAYEQVVAL